MTTNKFLGAGFASLGILVGSVSGLSSAKLTTTLLGLLFALIGGSVIAFIQKLDDSSRRAAGVSLLAFSLAATVGIYIGLTVRINDMLRIGQPVVVASQLGQADKPAVVPSRPSQDDYLKGLRTDKTAFLQAQIIRGEMQLRDACNALAQKPE